MLPSYLLIYFLLHRKNCFHLASSSKQKYGPSFLSSVYDIQLYNVHELQLRKKKTSTNKVPI